MEFNANFNKSHAENPCRTVKRNEISAISNCPYQIGNNSHFYYSSFPSESQSGNKSFMHLGSVSSDGGVHSEIPIYNQSILSQDSKSSSYNGESYNRSENPLNENLGISNQALNKSVSYQNAKPCTKGKKESGNSTSKGQWTPEEDSQLIELVHEVGEKKWAQVSHRLKGRVGKQCRERWLNHLKPGIKKEKITEEEELVIVDGHQQLGNKWAIIAKRLQGRSESSVKNHFYATKRRLNNKEAPKTYLEKYIMSLSSESSNNDDKEQVTPNDGADLGLICDFIQMDDASYGLVHNDQMLPTDDAGMVSPCFLEEAVISGNFVDEDFSVKNDNTALNFGMNMGFNLENDDQFLEAFTGWK